MTQADNDAVDAILAAARYSDGSARGPKRGARRGYYERARRRRGGLNMTLNLTPMVDTVFNLLFFFMLVSRFGAIEGLLPAKLPVREAPVAASVLPGVSVPRMPLRIRLEADVAQPGKCHYRIDRLAETPAPMRELPARLEHIRDSEPGFGTDTPVYLVAGDSVAWDHVVNAYNAAMSAKYDKIFFAGAP